MDVNKIVNPLKFAYRGDIKRVEADNKRLSESDTGADEMIDLITGKKRKPRAIENAEKAHGNG